MEVTLLGSDSSGTGTDCIETDHGTTRPPLRGGKAPPCFSKAPPLIYKGGAEGPPPLFSMIFQILQVLLEKFPPTSSFTFLLFQSQITFIIPISTVKSDQKFRFSETISFKRFLNVILVLKVSLTNSEFFQKFGSEEVPLLATFSHFVATFTNLRISQVPNVRRGSGLNEGVCIDE